MKHFITAFLLLAFTSALSAQDLKGLMKKTQKKENSGSPISNMLGKITGKPADTSGNKVAAGLKEALEVGAQRTAAKLSVTDGFFKNAALKIFMPEEMTMVEKKLRSIGLGRQVDDAILSMNRAAEDATKSAASIFTRAIRQMSIADATNILFGTNDAATVYLKEKATAELTASFRPVIEQSLAKVNATKYWNTLFTTYNRFSNEKVNTDLPAYVTEKALAGIFSQIALEEQKIREDPLARSTDLLKEVFSKNQ